MKSLLFFCLIAMAAMMDWFNNSSDQNLLSNRPANTGLGLVIVKKILQLHQFKYELKPAGEEGNIFVICLPVQVP